MGERLRRFCLTITALGAGVAGGLDAQPGRRDPEPRTIEGRVLLGSATGERIVGNQTVVLHRIASNGAGPLDSMRTDRDGRYRFRYHPPAPAPDSADEALYIVSTRFSGIAYFTPPIRAATVRGGDADIVVFDTTTGRIALPVRGRHVILTSPRSPAGRRVIDVFEIANDTSVTRVAGPAGSPSWSIRLPVGATAPRVGEGQGDVPSAAVRFEAGAANVFAPFSPGLKQLVLTYELPSQSFPVELRTPGGMGVLEVLLEEEAARVEGGSLARQDPVTLEGRTYRRYLARDVPSESVVRLAVPARRVASRVPPAAIVAVAGVLLALGATTARRGGQGATAPPLDAESLAHAIAALDAEFESGQVQSEAATARYRQQRAALKARLVSALSAVEEPRGRS